MLANSTPICVVESDTRQWEPDPRTSHATGGAIRALGTARRAIRECGDRWISEVSGAGPSVRPKQEGTPSPTSPEPAGMAGGGALPPPGVGVERELEQILEAAKFPSCLTQVERSGDATDRCSILTLHDVSVGVHAAPLGRRANAPKRIRSNGAFGHSVSMVARWFPLGDPADQAEVPPNQERGHSLEPCTHSWLVQPTNVGDVGSPIWDPSHMGELTRQRQGQLPRRSPRSRVWLHGVQLRVRSGQTRSWWPVMVARWAREQRPIATSVHGTPSPTQSRCQLDPGCSGSSASVSVVRWLVETLKDLFDPWIPADIRG